VGSQITKLQIAVTRTQCAITATSKGIWNPCVVRSRKQPIQSPMNPKLTTKGIDVVRAVPGDQDNLPKLEVPVEIQG